MSPTRRRRLQRRRRRRRPSPPPTARQAKRRTRTGAPTPKAAPPAPEPAPAPEPEPAEEQTAGQHDQRIIQQVTATPGLGLTEISKRLGVHTSTMCRLLRRLVSEKRLARQGGSYFPAEGQAA